MTDEARIKRLTELARRVWPDLPGVHVRFEAEHDHAPWSGVVYDARHLDAEASLLDLRHPRALDALEAALMTLADPEAKTTTRESFGEAVTQAAAKLAQSSADLDAKLREIVREPPAWVEKLAREWCALAKESHNVPVNGGLVATASHLQGNMLERCAAELRERAKGKP